MDQLLRITPSVPYLFSDSPLCSIYIKYGVFPIHVLSGVFFESRRDGASCESSSIYHISTYIIKGAQIKHVLFCSFTIQSTHHPTQKNHGCGALLTRFLVFNSSGESVMLNELYLLLVLIYICRFEFCQIDIN